MNYIFSISFRNRLTQINCKIRKDFFKSISSSAKDCIICKVEPTTGEDGEEDEEFVLVEDEKLAEKLIEIANTRVAEDEEE